MAIDDKTHEEEVLEAFHAYYQFWATRQHRDNVDLLLEFCTEGVTVIGSAPHEILVGADEYGELLAADLAENPGQLEVGFPWSRAKVFGETAIVEAEMQLRMPVDGSLQEIGPLFITQVYRTRNGKWLFEHCHMSFPSADQTEDEVWPTEALKARNLELERQVAERTAALRQKTEALEQALLELKTTQDQLIQSEKMASLGQLTAGIAHEIKNPLNFINNFAELTEGLVDELREAFAGGELVDELLDDLTQNASVIARHGKRADAIVLSMMQHATGGGGERLPADINSFVAEYVDLAIHAKQAHDPSFNVDVKRELAEDLGAVRVVPEEMGRVLLNLIGNAFDAVEGGNEPKVTISTHRSGEHVEIRVADNGPGISGDIRERIFEPFFTTKPTGTGTGLGLSLAYDIVVQGHGGTLSAESEEGHGATLICRLPLSNDFVP